ncbi:hypothetical protein HanRHA438_Chr09g0379461 [Helianthus annuus]|nr:hypothetical protein HanRHA438_Chr09g0379461 [Helianthus annuus]
MVLLKKVTIFSKICNFYWKGCIENKWSYIFYIYLDGIQVLICKASSKIIFPFTQI